MLMMLTPVLWLVCGAPGWQRRTALPAPVKPEARYVVWEAVGVCASREAAEHLAATFPAEKVQITAASAR
jgi:hypothetical protein